MSKFKVGDEVRTFTDCPNLSKLTIYTVRIVHERSSYVKLLFKVNDLRYNTWYNTSDLILAHAPVKPQPVIFKEDGQLVGILYEQSSTFRIGSVRKSVLGKVSVYLNASYWPDDKRDDRTGEQYMGDFESFTGFQHSGSFDDLEYQKV